MNPQTVLSDKALENLSDIGNYYERVVFDHLMSRSYELDDEQLADVACLALNKLPSWYIRHSVDAHFFLSEDQLIELHDHVEAVISEAVDKVKSSP